MTNHVTLRIIPGRIDPSAWRAAYEETLVLLKQFPFYMVVSGPGGVFCAARAAHQSRLQLKDCGGWSLDGDLYCGPYQRGFLLFDNIEYYCRQITVPDSGYDILLDTLICTDVPHTAASIAIWDGIVPDEDSYCKVLAIACLIVSRFPDSAWVSGNATAYQCALAVEWANQHLHDHIAKPVSTNADLLLSRIKSTGMDQAQILPAVYKLSLEDKNEKMGNSLKRHLPQEVITEYYKKRLCFSRAKEKYRLNLRILAEYLELGFDFKSLCRIIMVDPDGCQFSPAAFLKALIYLKLPVRCNSSDLMLSPLDWRHPENLTAKERKCAEYYLDRGKSEKDLQAYYPLRQIHEDFQDVLGYPCDVYGIVRLMRFQESYGHTDIVIQSHNDAPPFNAGKFVEEWNLKASLEGGCDIVCYKELMNYRKCVIGTFIRDSFVVSRIHQELFRKAVYLRRSLKRVWPAFSMLGPGERKEWFLKRNPLLLPQELWNNIVARITEDAFVRPYVALFSANRAAKSRKILRPLLWNRALLEHYWKLSEEKMNNRRGRD